MRCPKCDGYLRDGYCLQCGTIYLPRCPECGNTLEFETLTAQGLEFIRCSRCHNETIFEWVSDNRW